MGMNQLNTLSVFTMIRIESTIVFFLSVNVKLSVNICLQALHLKILKIFLTRSKTFLGNSLLSYSGDDRQHLIPYSFYIGVRNVCEYVEYVNQVHLYSAIR